MLIDARSIPAETEVKADLCIIGGGAAGITIARELAGSDIRVALLESGGLDFEQDTQALYEGENVGRDYYTLDTCRMRFLGGTTNMWSGACRPMDEVDFERHDWMPNSGWPISRRELDPFYRRAHEVCQIGDYSYDTACWHAPANKPLSFKGSRVINTVFQFSPPTRFGIDYREGLNRSKHISVYLHANVMDFDVHKSPVHLRRARVACLNGSKFWVSAKLFILAAGGIENARILLNANSAAPAGLGNQNDLVGRYFMDHVEVYSGLLMPSAKQWGQGFYKHQTVNKFNVRGAIALSSETVRREKILPLGAFISPYSPPGMGSYEVLADALKQGKWPDAFLYHLKQVILNIDELASHAYENMTSEEDAQVFILHNRAGPTPNRESRVTLSSERDALGKPRAQLKWLLSGSDKEMMRRGHQIIAEELGRAGLGRFKIELTQGDPEWPSNAMGGYHHMGTTRMDDDPKKGVVDRNCKVHGIGNLYVAGSSVFPTVGYSNPTLTIVALALRMADQVKAQFKRG